MHESQTTAEISRERCEEKGDGAVPHRAIQDVDRLCLRQPVVDVCRRTCASAGGTGRIGPGYNRADPRRRDRDGARGQRLNDTDRCEGRVRVPEPPRRRYELTAALQGFAPVRQALELTTGQRATLSLTLRVQYWNRRW